MKKITAFLMAIIMAFSLAGCRSAPELSSEIDSSVPVSTPQAVSSVFHTDETLIKMVEQTLGSDYLTYTGGDFVLYKGSSSVCMDDGSGTLAEYYFVSNYKSGDYRIEIYCGRYPLLDKYVMVRMEDGNITDAVRFAGRDMSSGFGENDKANVTADEKLTVGKIYCQRSGVTVNFDFVEDIIHVKANEKLDLGEFYNCLSISEDGMYSIYSRCQYKPEETCELRNNTTGEMTVLAKGEYYNTGFMEDGNLYIKNLDDYKIFDTDGNELFALSNHFPTGLVDESKDIWRKICGVYKDTVHGRYYVVYFDRGSSGSLDYVQGTKLLQDTYRMAVLDERGVRQQIIETGKYAETYNSSYSEVSIRMVNEHTISFYSERSNTMEFEVYVNLNTEEITLRDYRSWE